MSYKLLTRAIIAVSTALIGVALASPIQAQTVNLTATPQINPVDEGDQVVVDIVVTDAANLGAYQFDLIFNASLLNPVSVVNGSFLESTGRTAIVTGPSYGTGTLTFGAFTFGSTPPGPDGSGTLATITFDGLAPGTSTLDLSGIIVTNTSGNVQSSSGTDGSITINSTGGPTPTPGPSGDTTLTLTAPDIQIVTQDSTITLELDTPDNISGVDVILNYDPSAIQIDSLNLGTLFDTTPYQNVNSTTGTISFSQVNGPGIPAFTGSGTLATINFTPLTEGPTAVDFDFTLGDTADTNVTLHATGDDTLDAVTNLSLNIYDAAQYQLHLSTASMFGDDTTGTLSDGSGFSIPFSTNVSGLSGLLNLDNSFIGQVKNLIVKVSGYLTKTVSLAITGGLNTADYGELKAGDLNNDGIVSTPDLSLMYSEWSLIPGTFAADYDKNGVVNTIDQNILVKNYLATDE
jgi:hypothetical protein